MEASTEELGAEAKRLIAERRYDEAVRVSRRALLVAPDNVPLRVLLGEALLAQEKYDETRVEMLALTKRHPEQASAHRILGEAYLRVGQMEKARGALHQASIRGDLFAADLLKEAEGEAFVQSHTIERWFATDEPKTIETALPPIEEEDTPPPRKIPTAPSIEPSIQIDPAFAAELSRASKGEDASDMTQPMPRMPELIASAPEGLKSLLSKAQPAPLPATSTVVSKALVVPPPARVGQAPAPTTPPKPIAPTATSVARPSGWQKSDMPSSGSGINASSTTPATIKRATLQGTPSPLPKTQTLAGKPVDPTKTAAAASAFGSTSRKKPTLMGAPSPLAIRPPRMDDDDPEDLTTTNEIRLDLETTDRERALPESEEEDTTEVLSRAKADAAIAQISAGVPPKAPAEIQQQAPAPRMKKQTLMGVVAPQVPPRAAPPSVAPPPAQARPSSRPPPSELDEPFTSPMPATQPEISIPRPSAAPRPMSVPPPAAPPPMAAPASIAPRPPPPPARPTPPPPPMVMPLVAPPAPVQARPSPPQRMMDPPTDPLTRARHAGDTTAGRRTPSRTMLPALIVAVALGLSIIIGALLYVRSERAHALAMDVERASDEGRRVDIADAIACLEGDDSPSAIALRGRLLATRAVELGIGDTADSEMELGALDTAGGALLDARIARALVALSRGQADQSATLLSGVEGSGVTLAEALHAQALSLETLGQVSDARTAAVQAATLRPGGPRHAALVARLALALGDTQAAVAALAIPNADASPLVRLVRGRIALLAGDANAAGAEADAVLGPLLDAASPHDVAEAHVLRARAAIARGDMATARSALDAADSLRSPSDEHAALDITEGYLDAGATDAAVRVIGTLPLQSSSPSRRAAVVVRAALAVNDFARADASLVSLAPGSQSDLLNAEVRDAQGRTDEARVLYERAAADPARTVDARTREGEMLVRMGRPADARAVLDQVLRASPTDAHVAEIFVRIALASSDVSAAEAALAPALAAHPESTPLRSAHAQILLRRGHAAEAMTELQALAAAAPSDRDLQEALARAALASGDTGVATTAYESALRIGPSATAHLGLASVLAEEARFDEALEHVVSAEALGPATAVEVTRMRMRLDALRGLGAAALPNAVAATTASARDAQLWAYRAELEGQAETFAAAGDSVARALRLDANQPEALLVHALLSIEDGDLNGAARAVDRAERSASTRGLPPSFAARVAALRGRLRFEAGDEPGAERLGQQAATLDPHSGLAHLLLADVAIATHGDPVPELRLAAAGTASPPESVGRLAMRLRTGDEACAFAHAYIDRAPTGYDRADVDDVLRHCR